MAIGLVHFLRVLLHFQTDQIDHQADLGVTMHPCIPNTYAALKRIEPDRICPLLRKPKPPIPIQCPSGFHSEKVGNSNSTLASGYNSPLIDIRPSGKSQLTRLHLFATINSKINLT